MVYEQASGQQINRDKTTIFLSKAVARETKEEILNFLGVLEIKEYKKLPWITSSYGNK